MSVTDGIKKARCELGLKSMVLNGLYDKGHPHFLNDKKRLVRVNKAPNRLS